MRRVEQTSLVPQDTRDVHLVLDDLAPLGRVYRETDQAAADRETVIRDFLTGQFYNPQQVLALRRFVEHHVDILTDADDPIT